MRDSGWQKKFAQSKCRILHALHKLRKRRARKTSIAQADSKVTFHTITSSIRRLSRAIVVFGLSTLNSNGTNPKTRKKLANQKRRHMSLRLCGVRTRYCALIRRRHIQKV